MNEIEKYKAFLRSHYPFNYIPEEVLYDLASQIHVHHYGVGRTIYKKGDKGELLYIVNTGTVYEMIIDNEGEENIVSLLSQGDCFGAVSLLTDENHLVTVKVKEDVELYAIYKFDLDVLIEKHPVLNKYLNRILKTKLDNFFSFFEKEKIKVIEEIKDGEEKEKELSILAKVTELMNSRSPDTVLSAITEEMKNVMKADMCCIFLMDNVSRELVLEAASGVGKEAIKNVKMRVDEGLTGLVLRKKEPVVVEDMHADPRVKFISEIGEEKLKSLLSVPLIEQGKAIGVMNICSVDKRKFSYQDVRGGLILANHIALAVVNSRLRMRVEAIAGGKAQGKEENNRFVGETARLRKINSFIESASRHDDPVLIEGEEGTGKTLMASMIHKEGRRRSGPFIVVDCITISSDSSGEELFGVDQNNEKGNGYSKRGFLELADGGTIFLCNAESLNKVNQVKLFNFFKEGNFLRVNGKDVFSPNVRLISTVSIDLKEEVAADNYNHLLYESLTKTVFYMHPLRKRRRDIPIIANHIIERLNRELHKDIEKISGLAMERLLSYNWPGNILELENVLRRAVILAKDNNILLEQIFFGIPRVERKWEFNLLSVKWIKEFLLHKSFPLFAQSANFVMVSIFVSLLLFSSAAERENPANIIIWSAGWFFMYIAILLVGRSWCGICPFTLMGDLAKKVKSFSYNVPKSIVNYSNVAVTTFILFFLWVEGVSEIPAVPIYSVYLFLSIPAGAIIFSVLFERHVWCRYFCPLGGIIGIYSIFSFLTLKANRKICLSQCQTHECYLGGKKEGCALFLHPYGLENNQHCILCMDCLKNCTHNAIHLPIRMPFVQSPYIEPSAYIFSYLALALSGLILVENGSLLSRGAPLFQKLVLSSGLHEGILYTILFCCAALLPISSLYLFQIVLNRVPFTQLHNRVKEFGYAFIPLSLMGHISFYMKKTIVNGRKFGKGVEVAYDFFHVGEHTFGISFVAEVFIILAGVAGAFYTIGQARKRFESKYELLKSSLLAEKTLVWLMAIIYFCVIFP